MENGIKRKTKKKEDNERRRKGEKKARKIRNEVELVESVKKN